MQYYFGSLRFFLRWLLRIFLPIRCHMSKNYKRWEIYKVMDACWAKDVFVVQKPCKRGERKIDVYLQVHYKGKVIIQGKENYKQNSYELAEAIKKSYIYAYERLVL